MAETPERPPELTDYAQHRPECQKARPPRCRCEHAESSHVGRHCRFCICSFYEQRESDCTCGLGALLTASAPPTPERPETLIERLRQAVGSHPDGFDAVNSQRGSTYSYCTRCGCREVHGHKDCDWPLLRDALAALTATRAAETQERPKEEEILPSGVNLRVLRDSYGFAIDVNGMVAGLTSGDMGYENTGIRIPVENLDAFRDAEWVSKHRAKNTAEG